MKYDVFISYKSQSINVVKAIVHILENDGIRCWYAPRDLDNHSAGKDFDDKIFEAISNSQLLVVVLSNAALGSEWVKAEVTLGLKQKKLVIPYVVSELLVENGLRLRLENKHWIDAYPNPERKFSLLLKNIKLALNDTVSDNEDEYMGKRFNLEETEDYSVDFDYEEGIALLEAKEYNDAALAFIASAERGNIKAKNILCQMFYDIGDKLEYIQREVWDNIERQAKDGHCYANFLMHCKYYTDASNNLVAFEYLKKAIRKNSIGLAFLRMGIQYNWGVGIKQSHTLGMHYYQKALALNCKEAYSYIGQEYQGGSDKTQKDEAKAIELFQKGIEQGDFRSYSKLVYYYLYDKKNREKAIETAQKAISVGYDKGYSLMGDIYLGDYSELESNQDEAIRWYKEALRHDEKSAYGALALNYYNQSEYDDAYNMARKGRYAHDSQSFWILGLLYENDKKYKEAWSCYREQYERFGIGADNMANLVMNCSYRPENISDEEYEQMLDELEQKLEILSRNHNQTSLETLLKFYSFRTNGIISLNYDIVKEVPKAADFIKLGAEMGIPEMMFYLGNTIISDKNNEKVNPYKGLEWLEKAAYTGHCEAIDKLLEIYRTGNYLDNDELKKLISFCIKSKCYNEKSLMSIINWACADSEQESVEFQEFLISAVMKIKSDTSLKLKIANKLFQHSTNKGLVIPDAVIGDIRELIMKQYEIGDYGCLKDIVESVHCLFLDFDENKAIEDFLQNINSFEAFIFYGKNFKGLPSSVQLDKMDSFMTKLLRPIENDLCINEIVQIQNDKIVSCHDIWSTPMLNLSDSYKDIAIHHDIQGPLFERCEFNDIVPFFPLSLAVGYLQKAMAYLLSIRRYDPSLQNLIHFEDDEKLLNIAEEINDVDIQLFLISFVELKIYVMELIDEYQALYANYEKGNYQELANYLNAYIHRLDAQNIKHGLNEFTSVDVEHLLKSELQPDTESLPKNDLSINDINDSDEFDRLLNEFINSQQNEDLS